MDRLSATVPRNLRVRASVQLGTARVPARAFVLVATILVAGGVAVVGGADLTRTLYGAAGLILSGLIVLEGRLWGRPAHVVATLLLRHLRRAKRLRLAPRTAALPPEIAGAAAGRRPRWQQVREIRDA